MAFFGNYEVFVTVAVGGIAIAITASSLRFPAAYAQMLIKVAEVYGLPVETLLGRYGMHLPEGWQASPEVLIDGDQFAGLLQGLSDFIEQGGEQAQAQVLEFFPLTIHGYVGLAAMTAATLQQALAIGVQYFHQVMPAFDTGFEIIGDTCTFTVEPISDFGCHNALLAETTLCAVNSVLPFSDLGYDELEVTFRHDQLAMTAFPSFYPGITLKMGAARHSLVFPAKALGQPLRTGNMATFQMIEAELARRELFLANHQTLVYRVFMLIKERLAAGEKVDAETMARQLHFSLRTFNRRLQDEGTSFKTIHDQCRLDLATQLLRHSRKPMVAISAELGFANESSFSRYIKDKTGLSPLQYRKRAGA